MGKQGDREGKNNKNRKDVIVKKLNVLRNTVNVIIMECSVTSIVNALIVIIVIIHPRILFQN